MKQPYTLCFVIFSLVMLNIGFSSKLYAQDELTSFITSSKEDMNALVKAYSGPMLKSIGNNYNNGWYSTADPLNFGRFDIKFIATASFCPSGDKTFNLNGLGLNYFKTATGSPEEIPTVLGKKDQQAQIQILADVPNSGTYKVTRTETVPTAGINFMPGIIPQISVGLIKNTEVMLRFMPEIKISAGLDNPLITSLFGIGIKHDVKQWIPVMKKLPISMSVIGAYTSTSLYTKGPFLEPEDLPGNYSNPDPQDYTKQKINFDATSWNVGLVVSKKFPVVTIFGGLNYSASTSKVNTPGYYPYIKPLENDQYEIANIEKPIDVDVKTSQFGINGGFRLKLAIVSLTIQGTYAPGGYSSATAALGLGWFN